jgi:hypothetical protein
MQEDDREMTGTRIHSAAAGLVLFAFAAITAVSFIAVVGAALRLSGGVLALPIFIAALGLQAAKIGLPVEMFKLLRRRERLPARIAAAAWAAAFVVCAMATFAFFSAPHAVRAGRPPELARKIAALKSLERARDSGELDYEDYRGYVKRVVKLRAEVAEMRTRPPRTVVAGGGLAGQLLGVIGVVAELLSAGGLLFLRWGTLREDERITPEPEPQSLRTVEPAPEPTPLLPPAPRFVRGSELQFENLQWLWPGLLLANAFSLIGGAGGVGKSTIAASIAAMTARGGRWPTGEVIEPGAVIYCELEDDLRSVTGPALAAAGADMGRIDLCDEPFNLAEDLSLLTERVEALERDCGLPVRLVVLSPVRQFFGKEVYNDNLVRTKLQPFDEWLKAAPCCGLGVLHPKQGKAAFAGASAWKDKARAGIFAEWIGGRVGGERHVYALKTNSGQYGWSLSYDVEGAAPGGFASKRIVWGSAVRNGADGGGAPETGGDDAKGDIARLPVRQAELWLRGRLADGEKKPSTPILSAAAEDGFADRTVRRAARNIGVVIEKATKFGEPDLWSLP